MKVLKYLESYSEEFDLLCHLRFNTTVENKDELLSIGTTYATKLLIICTDQQVADDSCDAISGNFIGSITTLPVYTNKRQQKSIKTAGS